MIESVPDSDDEEENLAPSLEYLVELCDRPSIPASLRTNWVVGVSSTFLCKAEFQRFLIALEGLPASPGCFAISAQRFPFSACNWSIS
jgi:hypothetical protein